MRAVMLFVMTMAVVSAQSPAVEVAISHGRQRAAVTATVSEPYQGGPWAAIPATPLREGTAATASDFRVRAWREGDRTRAVVFAVLRDDHAPNGEREIQIATYLFAPGDSVDVVQTEKYGAARVTLSAAVP
jgi:Flp pilus assembly protein CpaB